MAPVCKFWQKGNCRNGNNCRFDHPGGAQQQQGGNPFGAPSGNQQRNPFNALRDDQPRGPRGGDSYRPGPSPFNNDRGRNDDRGRGQQRFDGQSGNSSETRGGRYDENAIKSDLSYPELQDYILSNYAGEGAGRDVPKHFFPSQMEVSQEELRVKYYLAGYQGQQAQAEAEENQLVQAARAEIEKVKQDPRGAIRMVVAGKREHPNRWDIVDENQPSWGPNPFQRVPLPHSAPSGPSQSSGFGQPSSLGTGANPFGQPSTPAQSGAFGQASQQGQQTSGFGQQSQLGQQPSGFGQPPQMGQQSGGFGQPSQTGQRSAFGQPSQPGAQQNPFGQPSQPQAASGFGQPSGLGARPAFGQPSAAGSVPGFGQPSAMGGIANKPNPFGQSSSNAPPGFGQQTQPSQANPFGQPSQQPTQVSAFSQQQGQGSSGGFGQPQQQANGFGQRTSGFGQPSGGFSQPAPQTSGGFGQQSQTNGGGFGQQQNAFKPAPATNGFSQPSLQVNTTQPIMNGSYSTNPPSATPRDGDPPDEMYGDKKGQFEEAYKHVLTTGTFADGIMPEIAPLHHWVGWGQMEGKFAPT